MARRIVIDIWTSIKASELPDEFTVSVKDCELMRISANKLNAHLRRLKKFTCNMKAAGYAVECATVPSTLERRWIFTKEKKA